MDEEHGKTKHKNDKEYQAVALNMREERVLQRTFETLSLEKTYALKLLDLDNRQMHLRIKRMKNTVTKIKSYLTPEEIIEMRRLEKVGKLKPECTGLKVSSAIRIAAAARRLNLGSEKRRALAEHKRRQARSKSNRHFELNVQELKQSTNWGIANIIVEQNGLQSRVLNGENTQKTLAESALSNMEERRGMLPLRPSTSNGFSAQKADHLRRTRSAHLYSSHKDGKSATATTRSQFLHHRRGSNSSEISLGNNAAKTQVDDDIEDLLEEEELKTMALQNKKHEFVSRVNDWIVENPHNVIQNKDFNQNTGNCINVSMDTTRDGITNSDHEARRRIEANPKQTVRRLFGQGSITTVWGLADKSAHKRESQISGSNSLKEYEFLLNYEDSAARLCKLASARSAQKDVH